jgi:PPOX class probable F420-dependent enzyme
MILADSAGRDKPLSLKVSLRAPRRGAKQSPPLQEIARQCEALTTSFRTVSGVDGAELLAITRARKIRTLARFPRLALPQLRAILANMPHAKTQILTRAVREFLSKPRIARLATIGPDGYPHIIPIYFMRDGDDILFGSDRDERKVRNALADPKAAVVIGGDPKRDPAGYMIQGDLAVQEARDRTIVYRMLRRYESKAEVDKHSKEWSGSDQIILRLKPRKVIRVW